MSYYAGFGAIFSAGMVAIALIIITVAAARAWRRSGRDLAELWQAGMADKYPVTRDDIVISPEWERIAGEIIADIRGHHGHSDAGLGDLDPDPGLGGER